MLNQNVVKWLFDSSVIDDELVYRILKKVIVMTGFISIFALCSMCQAYTIPATLITSNAYSLSDCLGGHNIYYPEFGTGTSEDPYILISSGVSESNWYYVPGPITMATDGNLRYPSTYYHLNAFSHVTYGLWRETMGPCSNQVGDRGWVKSAYTDGYLDFYNATLTPKHYYIYFYAVSNWTPYINATIINLTTCWPTSIYTEFNSGNAYVSVDFTLKDSTGKIITHVVGGTYGNNLTTNVGILQPGTYTWSGTAHFNNRDFTYTKQFTITSDCVGGGYLPNVTVTIPNSPYTNNTNWTNLTFPNTGWNISNYTLFPYLPWNITDFNISNRTEIYNYFNQSLLPPTMVTGYMDIIDGIINRMLAAILTILGVLLQPLTLLGNSINALSNMLLTYFNAILSYIKPLAMIFQLFTYILPPFVTFTGCIVLIMYFIWWVLYGRK